MRTAFVVWAGIEPATQGFSVLKNVYSYEPICIKVLILLTFNSIPIYKNP